MSDPTEEYKKIADAAEATAEGIYARAEALFPTHARGAEKLSREEISRDYQMAKATPDGMRTRLREMRQQFGLKRAAFYFMQWDKENRG